MQRPQRDTSALGQLLLTSGCLIGAPRPQASESRHDLHVTTHARYPHKPRSSIMPDEDSLSTNARRTPWNKGKLIGAKPPLRPNQVWSIRTRLLIERRTRDLALF